MRISAQKKRRPFHLPFIAQLASPPFLTVGVGLALANEVHLLLLHVGLRIEHLRGDVEGRVDWRLEIVALVDLRKAKVGQFQQAVLILCRGQREISKEEGARR